MSCSITTFNPDLLCKAIKNNVKIVYFNPETKEVFDEKKEFIGHGELMQDGENVKLNITQYNGK